MYPYSNYPNPNYPNGDPNNQGNVPPYPYPENPGTPPPYQPYNYQGGPQGQPPYNYYPPQPPRPQYGYVHPLLRAFGIVFLVIIILSLVGHHGFFIFPVFPLIIFAIIMLATRPYRYRYGWNRPYYRHHHNAYWSNGYQYPGQAYNYTQTPPPPGYYGPQQPPQTQQTQTQQGWPTPKDPYKNDTDENMENPY
ncbi:MAG: hypothetical protein J0I20_04295 [Chloroflexi bacterium]|nr:hypothetical protein [Chloroflexota bacterium]OJW04327.1 MAG: hypothetical protein BGO39_11215 [Chloroflexi bacterium 54-19]